MIHAKLGDKLLMLKSLLNNFKKLILIISENKEICSSFYEKNQKTVHKEILLAMDFEGIINQIKDLENNLNIIEQMNTSNKTYSSGFINLIISEFVNVDVNQFVYIQNHSVGGCISIINEIQISFDVYNKSNVTYLDSFLSNYKNYLNIFNNKSISFEIFDKLKHIQNNIVMIGANGSGKSTFSRNLKTILSKQITVIPSQQLLFYEAPFSIQTKTDFIKNVFDYHHQDKLGNTSDIKKYSQEDFTNLILAIKKDEEIISKRYYNTDQKEESILIKIQRIFEKLVGNKKIVYNDFIVNIQNSKGMVYGINSLSDGEKAIIYYAGHILFAEKNAYVVIDEPENHMHVALCDKLWNILEQERTDCTFVYLTHNLDFAVSRKNKTIIWNKSFTPPKNWDFEELPIDQDIPERLMVEIVGSKKNLLFCEGDNKSSLDYKLYNILFEDFTIIPMRTRDEVIRSVIAYNSNDSFNFKAIGIVDNDNYRDLSKMIEKGIYVLQTNEIENVLCDEEIIRQSINHFCTPNNYSLENFKEDFFKIFEKNIENLALQYTTDFINDKIQSTIICNRKDLNIIKSEFEAMCTINIDEIYQNRIQHLRLLHEDKNYDVALINCNLKKQLTKGLANKIVNQYEDRVLEFIDRNLELKKYIVSKYLSHVPSTL